MATNEKPLRVAVIGSGFAGLSAAIRLQAEGHEVTILEKRDQPGGRAYVYRDQGFTFDAGPTVITAPQCFEELFELAGKKIEDYVELMPVSPFYRLFWENGYVFDYSNDPEATFDQIRAKSPGDVSGYERFLEYSKEVFDEGYTRLAHVPFLEGKSSTGRLGIDIHATAGKGDVGFCGNWTLEISVKQPVKIYKGMPIGQLIYFPVDGEIEVKYNQKANAKYSGQPNRPIESMMWKNKF
jgi:hypothetical protein